MNKSQKESAFLLNAKDAEVYAEVAAEFSLRDSVKTFASSALKLICL